MCPGPMTQGEFSVAKVISKEPAEFYTEVVNCPDVATHCLLGAVAQPDEVVAVNKMFGQWACAILSTDTNLAWGWLKREDLNFDSIPVDNNPPKTAWMGNWGIISGVPGKENQLHISAKDRRLAISGASYRGSRNALGIISVTERDITGSAEPQGNKLTVLDDKTPCGIQVTLLGPYVLVNDIGECSNERIKFEGVYHRRTSTP